MKIKKLIAIAVISVSTVSLYAQEITTVKNYPQKKEYIKYNKNNRQYMSKTIYQYEQNGNVIDRVTYKWNKHYGWIATTSHKYKYNNNNQIQNIYYTKWDFSKEQWANKSENIIHLYDPNGKLMSIEQIKTDTKKDMLVSAY
jgi:hypothetical protein